MKITVKVDGYEWKDNFDEFYEMVRAESQMRTGRAVDRKAIRDIWNREIKACLEEYVDEQLFCDIARQSFIRKIVDKFDREAENKLYNMVKEYAGTR